MMVTVMATAATTMRQRQCEGGENGDNDLTMLLQ